MQDVVSVGFVCRQDFCGSLTKHTIVSLILESEVQALIAIFLSLHLIRLICNALSAAHRIPSSCLSLVQPTEVFSLCKEDHERQSADGDKDLVATRVVGYIVFAVELCISC